jgi:multiple sugar transport system permease protein
VAAAQLHAGHPGRSGGRGAGRWRNADGGLLRCHPPQALPGIISTCLFTFILSWNEYLYALVLVNTDEARPLTTGVMSMLVSAFTSMVPADGSSVMMSLPLIVIFAFLQSYLTRGFGAGA